MYICQAEQNLVEPKPFQSIRRSRARSCHRPECNEGSLQVVTEDWNKLLAGKASVSEKVLVKERFCVYSYGTLDPVVNFGIALCAR
jgi:hypothetical protein